MKRVLIIGSHSYLGTALASYLSQWPEEYRVESLSVRDGAWKDVSFQGYDAVYHTAALVHQERSKSDPALKDTYLQINTRLPVEVAQKAKEAGASQFIFLSTMAVYGLTAPLGKTATVTKDTPLSPKDLYGLSKAQAEENLLSLADSTFQVAILRPPMIYGRGCKGNYQQLRHFALRLPCFPKIGNHRSVLYVGNLNRLVRHLLDTGTGGIFCPQDREQVDTGRMVQTVARLHGRSLPLIPGFGWALSLLRPLTPKIDKAFGSLCYDPALSRCPWDYQVYSMEQALQETEAEPQ